MTRKQKKMTAAIGIISGAVILTTAALASYGTANGYQAGKDAALKLMENENYTAECSVVLTTDGSETETFGVKELYDRNGDVVLNRVATQNNDVSKKFEEEYIQDGKSIDITPYGTFVDFFENSGAQIGLFDLGNIMTAQDRTRMQKYIRFGELLGDTLVGDLKNNVVYVAGDENTSTYELSLNSVQIPEFINAGLSALVSSGNYKLDGITLTGDPYISSLDLKFTVDKEGRLTDGTFKAALDAEDEDGTAHSFGIDASLKLYDYGTTQPQRIDISSLENVNDYTAGISNEHN